MYPPNRDKSENLPDASDRSKIVQETSLGKKVCFLIGSRVEQTVHFVYIPSILAMNNDDSLRILDKYLT